MFNRALSRQFFSSSILGCGGWSATTAATTSTVEHRPFVVFHQKRQLHKKVAVLAGDGIGPEIMNEALRVLRRTGEVFGHSFQFNEAPIGGDAYDKVGLHLPPSTITTCLESEAILLGCIGGPVADQHLPKWMNAERNALLTLRKEFSLAINLRPAKVFPILSRLSPLKAEIVNKGVDLVIVRELVGGLYFGEHKTVGDTATDVMSYSEAQILKPLEFAFRLAQTRRKKLTVVDKANVLDTSRLWRRVTDSLRPSFPDVKLDYMFIDNASMQIIQNPSHFDVICTENLMGDILSDEASVLPGSVGLMPSASFGPAPRGAVARDGLSSAFPGLHLYEPISGSAPDIAGQNKANPVAQILSAAMMLRYSFGMNEEAEAVESAVYSTLESGYRTADIAQEGTTVVGTKEMGQQIVDRVDVQKRDSFFSRAFKTS